MSARESSIRLTFRINTDTKQSAAELARFKRDFLAHVTQTQKGGSTAYAKFERDASGSVKQFERASRQSLVNVEREGSRSASSLARSFVGGFSGAASSIASSVAGVFGGNLLTSALSGLTSQIKAQVTKGFDFLDLEERAEIAFKTMFRNAGASAEEALVKARALIADLVEFGAKTPFKTPQLIELTQQLVAVGFKAEEVIPTLRSIGDAVAGLGGDPEKLQRIITQLGQMKTTGQVSGEEIRTLAEAGIPAWRYLAEYAGKSVEQVRKLAQKNQLDADVAVKVIVAGMGRDFKGLMKDTEGTYSSMWSTIEDLNTKRAAEAFEPAFQKVKEGQAAAIRGLDSSAAQGFTQGAAALQKTLLGGIDKTLAAVATGDFKALGIEAVTSAAEGAAQKADELYKAGTKAAGQLEQGWRDRLQQNSPSQVLLRLGFDAGLSLAQGFQQGITSGEWKGDIEQIIKELESYFERMTGDKLPVKIGQTRTHNKLGFDHRNAADIQIGPNDPRFTFIEQFLNNRGVPFRASPGPERNAAGRVISTGAHTHVGNLSHNLASRAAAGVVVPVRIVGPQTAANREAATLEKERDGKVAEMRGHLETIQLEGHRLGRWVKSLNEQIAQSPLSGAADPDLIKQRTDIERQLKENADEYERYYLEMLKQIAAIEERIAAARERARASSLPALPSSDEPFVVSEAGAAPAEAAEVELPASQRALAESLAVIKLEAPKVKAAVVDLNLSTFEYLKALGQIGPEAEAAYGKAAEAANKTTNAHGTLVKGTEDWLAGLRAAREQLSEEADFSGVELAGQTLAALFVNLKESVLGSVDAVIFSGKSLKKALADAFRDALAQTAAFLGKKALLKGMEETAEALSSLAAWDFVGFAKHTAAAAGWFALAAAAAVGGKLIAGSGGGAGGSGSGGSSQEEEESFETDRMRRERERAEADEHTRREERASSPASASVASPQVIVYERRVKIEGVDNYVARQIEDALNNNRDVQSAVDTAAARSYATGRLRERVMHDAPYWMR